MRPFLYALAASAALFHLLFSCDDNDLKQDLALSIFDLNSSALPLFDDIEKEISGMTKEKTTAKDYSGLEIYLAKEGNIFSTSRRGGDCKKDYIKEEKFDKLITELLDRIAKAIPEDIYPKTVKSVQMSFPILENPLLTLLCVEKLQHRQQVYLPDCF